MVTKVLRYCGGPVRVRKARDANERTARLLTAAAVMAGDDELAQASLAELRRAQPSISLAWISANLPLPPGQREFFLEAMRRAGLE